MASKSLKGGKGEGSKWSESKVYSRKSQNNKVFSKKIRQPLSSSTKKTLVSEDGNSHSSQQPPRLTRFDDTSDDSSSMNRRQVGKSNTHRDIPPTINGFSLRLENRITINVSSKLKQEIREIRRKLINELDQVRNVVKKLEATELQLSGASNYTNSQLSTNYVVNNGGDGSKRDKFKTPLPRLSISSMEDSHGGLADYVQKEKRTPKANQYYRNSEFVLEKDKLPPQESNKKLKLNSGKKKDGGSGEGNYGFGFGMDKNSVRVFKSCSDLLAKLMKHKHGWVFNTPVDVKGLGLRDYCIIIKKPMDLGTVKTRLNKNRYKSPKEFAEDVKLTFGNAMSYNQKGQDVHIMAEELLKIFEDKWVVIQAEINRNSRSEVGLSKSIGKRSSLPPEMKKGLDKSELTPTVPVNSSQSKSSDVVASGRIPSQKKPKANDVNKREMSYEEKQRLSTNLQSLPLDKLDNIVQIIKNRNSSLLHSDDEIEVDIDTVDTETLWELDRFVTNYKKSLSKNKRKAENAIQPREESNQKVEETEQALPAVEMPKETETALDTDEKDVPSSLPVQEEKREDIATRSSSSSSSSSDSGSSSSDSDSDSSSESDS